MHAYFDTIINDFLLHVGNGDEPIINEYMIKIPNEMQIKYEDDENPEECLINVFPSLKNHAPLVEYITKQAILVTTNDYIDILNEKLIETFPREFKTYYSFDYAIDDTQNYY